MGWIGDAQMVSVVTKAMNRLRIGEIRVLNVCFNMSKTCEGVLRDLICRWYLCVTNHHPCALAYSGLQPC